MKRDMNLIREILLEIENQPSDDPFTLEIAGRSRDEIHFHADLLKEAGFIKGGYSHGPHFTLDKMVDGYFVAYRMTWAGHEFLATARSEAVWKTTMQKVGETTGTVAVPVLTAMLTATARKMLGLDP